MRSRASGADGTGWPFSGLQGRPLERLTKALVIASVLAAACLEAMLGAREWGPLLFSAAAAFIVAFGLALLLPRLIPGLILAFIYILPSFFVAGIGRFVFTYDLIWVAALLGAMVATSRSPRWAFPTPWKFPLIAWALIVAASWPIVVCREIDFTPSLLWNYRLSNSGGGVAPPVISVFIASVAVMHGVGLLWFDWLFQTFPAGQTRRFQRGIAMPLAASAFLASLVGIYQGFFDITWLSGGVWPGLRRATGSMLDANAFGTVAALWGPAFVVLAYQERAPGRWLVGAVGMLVCWTGLWVTASRSALLAAVIGFAFLLYYAWSAASSRLVRARLAAAVFGLLLTLTLLSLGPTQSINPVNRAQRLVPSFSVRGFKHSASELWNRQGWGAAAVQMISEFPLLGVGIGTFHTLVTDYTYRLAGIRVAQDNAQNWYRHQMAEFGIVGSIALAVWVAMFILVLIRTRTEGEHRFPAGVIKGLLVALGCMSLVAMPTQNTALSLTFWTLAFWYVLLAEPPAIQQTGPTARLRGTTWVAIVVLAGVHAAGTAYLAQSALRVPARALRGGWTYSHGFYDRESSTDRGRFSWTKKQAVAVFPAESKWLRVTMWVSHPDVVDRPVRVKLWSQRQLVLETELTAPDPITTYVQVPDGQSSMMISTWVDRTWQPADYGQRDERELGLAVAEWTFAGEPPRSTRTSPD